MSSRAFTHPTYKQRYDALNLLANCEHDDNLVYEMRKVINAKLAILRSEQILYDVCNDAASELRKDGDA